MFDDKIVVLGVGGHVAALDATTGAERWRTPLQGNGLVTLAFAGDKVIAAAAGEVFCLERKSGRVVWHNKMAAPGLGPVCFGDAQAAANIADIDTRTHICGSTRLR